MGLIWPLRVLIEKDKVPELATSKKIRWFRFLNVSGDPFWFGSGFFLMQKWASVLVSFYIFSRQFWFQLFFYFQISRVLDFIFSFGFHNLRFWFQDSKYQNGQWKKWKKLNFYSRDNKRYYKKLNVKIMQNNLFLNSNLH